LESGESLIAQAADSLNADDYRLHHSCTNL